MLNKKAISPVVATALLLVVAVTAVVGFQTFFNSYSSGLFTKVESQSNVDTSLVADGIISNTLYLRTGTSSNLTLLKISDASGNQMCSFSGISTVNSTGLVGWWKLNDENSTIKDYSGNGNDGKLYGNTRVLFDFNSNNGTTVFDKTSYSNNGTLMNGVNCATTGINGNGCTFDGINDYINLSNISLGINETVSVSFWIKKNYSAKMEVVLGKYNGAEDSGWIFVIPINGSVRFDGRDGYLQYKTSGSSLTNISNNQWHHILGQKNKNSWNIYVDGNLENSFFYPNSGSIITSMNLLLGLDGALSWNFNGTIDEVAIYSKALSDAEVLDLYNSQKAKFVEFKSSKLDKVVEFDGVDDYIEILNSTDVHPDNISVIAFFKSNSLPGQTCIVGKHSSNGYGLFVAPGNLPKFQFDTSTVVWNFSQNIADYQYEVLVGTFNGTTSSIYLNGILSNSSNVGSKALNPGNLTIGALRYNAQFFNGQIDEVRIYNRTLSDAEIKTLYWYSIKSVQSGVSEIDVSSCNLTKGVQYNVVAFTDNNKVEETVLVK